MQLKPPGRRVSVLGDLQELHATWRPTSWICNRVTGALTGACVAVSYERFYYRCGGAGGWDVESEVRTLNKKHPGSSCSWAADLPGGNCCRRKDFASISVRVLWQGSRKAITERPD